jgi:biotin carboxylase
MFISKKIQALCTIDEINVELQQRNNLRLVEAKEKMGKTYLLHPENAIARLCQKPEIEKAMEAAGTPCPNAKKTAAIAETT